MSITVTYDITIPQGLIVAEAFAPEYVDPDTGGLVRQDFTGYSATFTVWPTPATFDSLHDTEPVLRLTDATGAVELGLFDSDEFGQYGILLYLTQSQTSAIEPFGTGVYNLDIIDPFGHPQIRFHGAIRFAEGERHG